MTSSKKLASNVGLCWPSVRASETLDNAKYSGRRLKVVSSLSVEVAAKAALVTQTTPVLLSKPREIIVRSGMATEEHPEEHPETDAQTAEEIPTDRRLITQARVHSRRQSIQKWLLDTALVRREAARGLVTHKRHPVRECRHSIPPTQEARERAGLMAKVLATFSKVADAPKACPPN